MIKSTMVKWAAAALLAVPAIPTLGARISHLRTHHAAPTMLAATTTTPRVHASAIRPAALRSTKTHAIKTTAVHSKHLKLHSTKHASKALVAKSHATAKLVTRTPHHA